MAEKGFEIPDSLIDTAIKIASPSETTSQKAQTPKFSISKEQINLLKESSALLEQYGIDPKILDNLSSSANNSVDSEEILPQNIIKKTLKDQLQNALEPYLGIIPAVLTALLFFTLLSFASILNLFIYPLLWIIFYILEKSGFVKFTTETRTVRKMVI